MAPVALRKLVALPMVLLKRQVYRRFLERLDDPRRAQQEKLTAILASMRGSAFARDFDLTRVRTVDDLRQALPIAPYERVAPYVERVKNGEISALFAPRTRVHMFAMTSGTTAAAKFIPVTSLSVTEYLQSWTVWGYGVSLDYPEVPYGGIINMASSWRARTTPAGIPAGSVTGLLFNIMHRVLRVTHAVPPIVADVTDVDRRHYLILRLGLARQDTMMFNVANPATLVNLAERLDTWKSDLIRDLHDGTLRDAREFPEAVRASLRTVLGARHRELAARLERIAVAGQLTPRAAWPRLALLGVWTGGTLGAYMPLLLGRFGNVDVRDHGLSASEGRVTVPLASHQPFGPLNVDGAFYEFIPEREYGKENPVTLLADQLDQGQRYYLVMTTSGGLVRYDLSDVVECTGHQRQAPLLKFLNKGRHIANLTGEKLSAYQVTSATAAALASLGLILRNYTLAPAMSMPPRYHLLIERRDLPPPRVADALAAALDTELVRANVEYADKRASRRLGPVKVTAVPDGMFESLKAAKVRDAGTPAEHYKHPFLITDPEFARAFTSADGANHDPKTGSD